jgi:hypothetical protein
MPSRSGLQRTSTGCSWSVRTTTTTTSPMSQSLGSGPNRHRSWISSHSGRYECSSVRSSRNSRSFDSKDGGVAPNVDAADSATSLVSAPFVSFPVRRALCGRPHCRIPLRRSRIDSRLTTPSNAVGVLRTPVDTEPRSLVETDVSASASASRRAQPAWAPRNARTKRTSGGV